MRVVSLSKTEIVRVFSLNTAEMTETIRFKNPDLQGYLNKILTLRQLMA